MKISADAWSKFTGYKHNVAEAKPMSTKYKDGIVEFRIKTKHLSLSGNYDMRIQLSAEEVQSAYVSLIQGPALEKLEAIEKKLK